MAVTKDEIRNAYPLPVYNYLVEIDGETVAFSEVSGINVGFETTTYKESPSQGGSPGPRVMHMPAQRTDPSLTLKKGLVRDASIAVFYNWIASTQNNLVDKKDIIIRLCDEHGVAVISWKVTNAFPTKLDAPTFDANSNDVAIETMELKADAVFIEQS
ncbi:MAG: phage tail protein [Pseudomonadales bacterium]|nr:phage tail protein [Pseudomonadales bacterium]